MTFLTRIRQSSRELILFTCASLALGVAYSMYDSVFNNYLNARFTLSGFQRSFLEFPREMPGVIVMFVSALLWFLCSRRLSAISMLLGAVGACLIGFASSSYNVMVIWLFIYSLGQHIFLPLSSGIGMELARQGQAGQRLGQLNAVRNLATILGSFAVFVGFKFFGLTFQITFLLAAIALSVAGVLMFAMKPETSNPPRVYLKLHREYRLYYVLSILAGARKQLFITFAPWVLVTIFKQPTQIIATLLTIGGIIGILFQPFLGRSIDRYGERAVLAAEALALVVVCFGYGFAKFLLPEGTAFLVVCVCYLLDQMLFSVSMARATFMKKIALQPDHIQPALTAGVSIDHVFSIAAALVGGVIWNQFGFQYVFLFGMCIAAVNLITALQVRVPVTPARQPAVVPLPDNA